MNVDIFDSTNKIIIEDQNTPRENTSGQKPLLVYANQDRGKKMKTQITGGIKSPISGGIKSPISITGVGGISKNRVAAR
jgi:hypothetical protein